MEVGGTAVFRNVTLSNNGNYDVRLYTKSNLTLQDSTVSRPAGPGEQSHLLKTESQRQHLRRRQLPRPRQLQGRPRPPASPRSSRRPKIEG